MPDNEKRNPKAGIVQEPDGKDGNVQHPHSPAEQQSGESPPKAQHKRQRRIEDWFPN